MSPSPHPADPARKRWRYHLSRRTRVGLAALALTVLIGALAYTFIRTRDDEPPPTATPMAAGPPSTIAAAAGAKTRAGEPPANHEGAGMIAVLVGLGERLATPIDAGPDAAVDDRRGDAGAVDDSRGDDRRGDDVDAGQGAAGAR